MRLTAVAAGICNPHDGPCMWRAADSDVTVSVVGRGGFEPPGNPQLVGSPRWCRRSGELRKPPLGRLLVNDMRVNDYLIVAPVFREAMLATPDALPPRSRGDACERLCPAVNVIVIILRLLSSRNLILKRRNSPKGVSRLESKIPHGRGAVKVLLWKRETK